MTTVSQLQRRSATSWGPPPPQWPPRELSLSPSARLYTRFRQAQACRRLCAGLRTRLRWAQACRRRGAGLCARLRCAQDRRRLCAGLRTRLRWAQAVAASAPASARASSVCPSLLLPLRRHPHALSLSPSLPPLSLRWHLHALSLCTSLQPPSRYGGRAAGARLCKAPAAVETKKCAHFTVLPPVLLVRCSLVSAVKIIWMSFVVE
jgi:hypothetical protein